MRLLVCLAEHAGEVVSIDDLLSQVWSEVVVTPDSVYQAVASLRRLLGDDPKQPTYIATVPRLGYRMVATVSPWVDMSVPEAGAERAPAAADVRTPGARLRVSFVWAVARLIRSDNGYVVWSEAYDRPLNDILMVQDDIAGEVTKALRASIEARPAR
jgi:hypothetical protein